VQVAVPKERSAGETRVALVPDVVARLVKTGHAVAVESGAGEAAGFPDAAYAKAGATIARDGASLLAGAHVVARVQPPSPDEAAKLPRGSVLVSFLWPAANPTLLRALLERGVTAFAMDLVPRTTRAQTMDALSSMSTVSGYRAALMAAQHLQKFMPMLMTAAGTISPARVVVIGAGVAGLMAIATCRRLGAVVEAYDVRPEAREEARSLGATPIEVDVGESGTGEGGYAKKLSEEGERRLAAKLAERVRAADAVITTAQVPGRTAPCLVSAETLKGMRPGAVVVDLAAETGGNCAATVAGEVVVRDGVTIVGAVNVPASMASDASRMYAKNVQDVLGLLAPPGKDGKAPPGPPSIDFADEIVAGAVAVHGGEARHAAAKEALAAGARA
jgi:NAD(P) transhydrogenase subunit alpha